MGIQPLIVTVAEKKLLGKRIITSITKNKTSELWRSFMPRRREIQHKVSSSLYSVQCYDPLYFTEFNPSREFEKWAAQEVSHYETVPQGLEFFTLPTGLYAIFLHIGPAVTAPVTFQYVFGTWLPNSLFLLDNRPHFEVMPEGYNQNDPKAQEEFYIPIKPRGKD